jgi:hypothetical protein
MPECQINADPDPGQTLLKQKVGFGHLDPHSQYGSRPRRAKLMRIRISELRIRIHNTD